MAQDKGKTKNTKGFQITMDEKVHGLLKRRARVLNMNIGGLIQNLFTSLEHRLEKYKEQRGGDINVVNDELDARLMNVLLKGDAGILTDNDVKFKFDKLIKQYQTTKYRTQFIDVDEEEE